MILLWLKPCGFTHQEMTICPEMDNVIGFNHWIMLLNVDLCASLIIRTSIKVGACRAQGSFNLFMLFFEFLAGLQTLDQ